MENNLNITPDPRILRILGEIEITPLQCLCELIDNSIDAFPEDINLETPEIIINLPRDNDIENSNLQPSAVDRGQFNWIFQNIISNSDFKTELKDKKAQFEEFALGSNSKLDGRIRKNYTSFKSYLKIKIHEIKFPYIIYS